MSYTPTEWQTGDTITAEELNKMEGGIENANEPFIVALTPTAEDFSGVMDKTVGAIKEAYKAGRKIVFRVMSSATEYVEIPTSAMTYDSNDDTLIFSAYLLTTSIDALVSAYNAALDDASYDYSTIIYHLTPMT